MGDLRSFFYHLPSDGMEDVDQACVVVDPHVALSHCLGLRGGLPQGKALHLDKRGSGTAAERQRHKHLQPVPGPPERQPYTSFFPE